MKTVWFLGATGSVGRGVLEGWEEGGAKHRVHAIGRRDAGHGTIFCRNDFTEENLLQMLPAEQPDVIVCALGSNYVHAKSPEEFLWIDREVPKRIARQARLRGCERFVLVSTLGAHPYAPMLFARAKGQLERDLSAMNFRSLVVLRPSFILDSTVARVGIEQLAMQALHRASSIFPVLQRTRFAPTDTKQVALQVIEAVE